MPVVFGDNLPPGRLESEIAVLRVIKGKWPRQGPSVCLRNLGTHPAILICQRVAGGFYDNNLGVTQHEHESWFSE
jgi:hypothetical protein